MVGKNLIVCFNFIIYFNFVQLDITVPALTTVLPKLPEIFNQTRRILGGNNAGDTRPYMVYLRSAQQPGEEKDSDWLCGGCIIHEQYILTSAACIEDAKHFYVISGTHKWKPSGIDDECIKYGSKKAVWKCVPQSYVYDGAEFDNIRWMISDIAVVKVEEEFNFNRRVRGCDFIPKMISYNNVSQDLEKPKSIASIAGWGSTGKFNDLAPDPNFRTNSTINSPELLEADVVVMTKRKCKKRWPQRYHYIIDKDMICGKDTYHGAAISAACLEHHVDCKELIYSDEEDYDLPDKTRRVMDDPVALVAPDANHSSTNSTKLEKEKLAISVVLRRAKVKAGGFCENDHGGPLVVGHGKTAVVIGVMSACQNNAISHVCTGPFLYTSVYKYRHLISCAINKEMGETCRRWLRTSKSQLSETSFDWSRHPAGPAKMPERKSQQQPISKLPPPSFRSEREINENDTHV